MPFHYCQTTTSEPKPFPYFHISRFSHFCVKSHQSRNHSHTPNTKQPLYALSNNKRKKIQIFTIIIIPSFLTKNNSVGGAGNHIYAAPPAVVVCSHSLSLSHSLSPDLQVSLSSLTLILSPVAAPTIGAYFRKSNAEVTQFAMFGSISMEDSRIHQNPSLQKKGGIFHMLLVVTWFELGNLKSKCGGVDS